MWSWLLNHVFDRARYREVAHLCDENKRIRKSLDRRIAEAFTPEEWSSVRERCERKLRDIGI